MSARGALGLLRTPVRELLKREAPQAPTAVRVERIEHLNETITITRGKFVITAHAQDGCLKDVRLGHVESSYTYWQLTEANLEALQELLDAFNVECGEYAR